MGVSSFDDDGKIWGWEAVTFLLMRFSGVVEEDCSASKTGSSLIPASEKGNKRFHRILEGSCYRGMVESSIIEIITQLQLVIQHMKGSPGMAIMDSTRLVGSVVTGLRSKFMNETG